MKYQWCGYEYLWMVKLCYAVLCYDLLMLDILIIIIICIDYYCYYCIWLLIWWILHMGVWVDIDPMPGFRMYTLPIEKTCSAISLSCLSPGFWSWLLIPLLGSFIFIGRSSFMEKFQWSCQKLSCILLAIWWSDSPHRGPGVGWCSDRLRHRLI